MKLVNKLSTIFTLIMSLTLFSCSKDNVEANGISRVKFVMQGVVSKNSNTGSSSPKDKIATAIGKTQRFSKAIGDGKYLHVDITANNGNALRADNSTSIREDLEKDTYYRIVVYDAEGNYIAHTDEKAGSSLPPELMLPINQTYQFLFYSYLSKDPLPEWTYSDDNLSELIFEINKNEAITSTLTSSVNQNARIVSPTSQVPITLKPNYAELIVNLNSQVGNITGVQEIIIDNVYEEAKIKVASDENYIVPISDKIDYKLPNFTSFGTSQIQNTKQALILEDGDKHTITFKNINIYGHTIRDISANNLELYNGVRYTASFTITNGPTPGIEIESSDLIWAPGNLVYNNGIYGFASDQNVIGDYWIWNWLTPKGLPQTIVENGKSKTLEGHQIAEIITTGYKLERDPCTKVISKDGVSWRTPTLADYKAIIKEVPLEPNVLNVTEDTYNGVSGVYYGTRQVDDTNFRNHLFLPRAGIFDGEKPPGKDHWSMGYGNWYQSAELKNQNYLGLQINIGVKDWQAKDYFKDSNYVLTATQIRCVKDKNPKK